MIWIVFIAFTELYEIVELKKLLINYTITCGVWPHCLLVLWCNASNSVVSEPPTGTDVPSIQYTTIMCEWGSSSCIWVFLYIFCYRLIKTNFVIRGTTSKIYNLKLICPVIVPRSIILWRIHQSYCLEVTTVVIRTCSRNGTRATFLWDFKIKETRSLRFY